MSLALYYIGVILLSGVPFEKLLPWLFALLKEVRANQERPKSPVYVSWDTPLFFLVQLCNFAKGFLPVYYAYSVMENDYVVIAVIPLILILHNWNPFNRFRNRRKFGIPLWGIYTALFWPSIFIFPLLYALLSIVLNSFLIGFLSTVVVMLFVVWFSELALFYLPLNFMIFLVVFFSTQQDLFRHFEGSPQTVLTALRQR